MADIISLIGILLCLLTLIPFSFFYHRRIRSKSFYRIIWKKSSSIKSKDILRERQSYFHDYYYQRLEDETIRERLHENQNVLIIGPPLSGKSRAIYQTLLVLAKPHDVLIPRYFDITPESFLVPMHLTFWRPRILLLDDLHQFVELKNFEYLLRIARENNFIIVAACRSEMEYNKVKNLLLKKNIFLETIFGDNVIELPKIPKDIGEEIATTVGISWDLVTFDGNVGSIFMKLGEMERRFAECSNVEKTFLRVLKKLYVCGIYEEHQLFPLDWIKTVAKNEELEGREFEWTGWLEQLREKEFITIEQDRVWAEGAYLENIVKLRVDVSDLTIFSEMISIFSEIPDVLFKIGSKASDIGIVQLEKAGYMKTAIRAYEAVFQNIALEYSLQVYATIQTRLGDAYWRLAEVEAPLENCDRAIAAYEEALLIWTHEDFPIQYATTQNGMGNAYCTLAEVTAPAENCKRAINAFKAALQVWTLDNFPIDYSITQNNLGAAYSTLTEVEEKAANCKRAIAAYEAALQVKLLEYSPINYAWTQNNLGVACNRLAEVEEKAANCKRAIAAYEATLQVYTCNHFPRNFAETQKNLGGTYRMLAEVEAKATNCKRAIVAYKAALQVFTKEEFPEINQVVGRNLRDILIFCGED